MSLYTFLKLKQCKNTLYNDRNASLVLLWDVY